MHNRRRFLRMAGATAFVSALPACSGGDATAVPKRHRHSSSTTGAGGGGGGGGGDGGAGGSAGCAMNPVGLDVGPPATYETEGLHKVPATSVLIGRDAGGVYALSAVCTHSGCNLNKYGQLMPNGIRCLCHGSQFGADGQVLYGPAVVPLRAYAVENSCDGTLVVDTSSIVPNTQRTPG